MASATMGKAPAPSDLPCPTPQTMASAHDHGARPWRMKDLPGLSAIMIDGPLRPWRVLQLQRPSRSMLPPGMASCRPVFSCVQVKTGAKPKPRTSQVNMSSYLAHYSTNKRLLMSAGPLFPGSQELRRSWAAFSFSFSFYLHFVFFGFAHPHRTSNF